MPETSGSAHAPGNRNRRGWIGRWSELTPAGKRRIGEFVANIALGAAAATMTLIVIPSLVGRAALDVRGMAGGVIVSAACAILAGLTRLFTEQRIGVANGKAGHEPD